MGRFPHGLRQPLYLFPAAVRAAICSQAVHFYDIFMGADVLFTTKLMRKALNYLYSKNGVTRVHKDGIGNRRPEKW